MPITKFVNNSAGLNLTDSPLSIKDAQATGQSYNYDYSTIGAISKILAASKVNTIANTQLKTLGLNVLHLSSDDSRTAVRCSGTKIQTLATDTGVITNQVEDTVAAVSDFLDSTSTQPVAVAPFNALLGGGRNWMAGGGMSAIYGFNGSKVTKNGADPATGSVGLSLSTTGSGGAWLSTGTRWYAIVLRKRQTLSQSNAALDISINVDDVTKNVIVDFTSLTIDKTKYDKILLYRSAVSGVTSFTAGDLVTTLDSATASYTDSGTSAASSQVVPRSGGTTDNSVLPAGTYKTVTTFKRRLVAAYGGTLQISDLNKDESWPIANVFTPPSGGPILAVAAIGTNSEFTTGADEYLLIFKERELWALTGTGISDWELKFIAKIGTINQNCVISMSGYAVWMAFNGIYAWDGSGKPTRISRPINALWGADGDIDKTKLNYSWGVYFEKMNEVVWRVSHRTKGEQQLSIKLDVRLTIPQISQNVENREADGVFVLDTDSTPLYAGCAFRPTSYDEQFIVGDGSGFTYKMFNSASTAVSFDYETRPLDMGFPEKNKLFKRVLVWVERLTDNELTLYYWADLRQRTEYQSKSSQTMAPVKGTAPSLWDVAFWDISYWDDYVPDIGIIDFKLHSEDNNMQGTSLKLKFEQLEANAPVRIHAFAIDWDDLGDVSVALPAA